MTNTTNCPSCGAPLKVKFNKTGENVCEFCGYPISLPKIQENEHSLLEKPDEFYQPDPPPKTYDLSEKSEVDTKISQKNPAKTPVIPEEVIQIAQRARTATGIIVFLVIGLMVLALMICVGAGLLVFSNH